MFKKMNGHKKYIGIYGLLITILAMIYGYSNRQSAEAATQKTLTATAIKTTTENRLYFRQETSRLDAEKLDREVFRQYVEHTNKTLGDMNERDEVQRKEQRADMKEIKELFTNGR